jgi:hypothetical protein
MRPRLVCARVRTSAGGQASVVRFTPATYGRAAAFHHVLAVRVPPEGALAVEVVRFSGTPTFAKEDER